MAQYYPVLNQEEKPSEEIAQFYPNLDENQTIQYVIASPDSSQYSQAQQVVVSSEQLMVLEGQQGQQVIIDQAQVAFQQPSYIIQKTAGAVDYGSNQVYYMTQAGGPRQQIVVEQAPPPPVVINQLMPAPMPKMQQLPPPPMAQNRVIRHGGRPLPSIIQRAAPVNKQVQNAAGPVYQGNMNDSEDIEDKILAINNGHVMGYQQKRLQMVQNAPQAPERLSPAVAKKPRVAPFRARIQKPKLPTLPRNFFHNTATENIMYATSTSSTMPSTTPMQSKQNIHSYNAMQKQQQRNATLLKNQYIVQPSRAKVKKADSARSISDFPHSTQIQNILDNTPKSEEYSNSIRMLIWLENGEQRLITFTLPKEACKIQEILEQVNVPFDEQTEINVLESEFVGLDYVVYVGKVHLNKSENEASSDSDNANISRSSVVSSNPSPVLGFETENGARKAPSPEDFSKEAHLPPKFIEGKLAVCTYCGYLSEDFSRCPRCRRRLPADVKSIENQRIKHVEKANVVEKGIGYQKTNGIPRMNLLPKKRTQPKPKMNEFETVVVSSDDEDGGKSNKSINDSLRDKLGTSVTLDPITKEPSPADIKKYSVILATREKVPDNQTASMLVNCRTIRIGSYRFVPPETVRIESNMISIKVPHPKQADQHKILKIDNANVIKVLVNFQKSLPVIFFYLSPLVGEKVRAALDMHDPNDCYFDPLSETHEPHRRITLLPENLSEEGRVVLQKIYNKNQTLMEELTNKEVNDILLKTCPKELCKSGLNLSGGNEVRQILSYPPGERGRITINSEDYMCLGADQFLNDVIIDFYLKYLVNNLEKERQEKVHLFSTFFYKRLTTKPLKVAKKPLEPEAQLSPAEKRHGRVKTWTKNVNIFEKDFIIIPINENCHWFLAIICYPNMNGCRTVEDNRPIKIEPKQISKKKNEVPKTLGVKMPTSTITKEKIEKTIMFEEDMSDKDEAEGDESELDTDDSEEVNNSTMSVENNKDRPAIKQPCILIFDSLAGASRSRVVATLRDYLTCEYKAKLNTEKVYTKDVIKGACPKVPQQMNFTDCGLYLLQYVEHFFHHPITDYHIPISSLKTWFEEITVTKKREDIGNLIKTLMQESQIDLNLLPDVVFPTLNGEVIDILNPEREDQFLDPEEEQDIMEEEDDEDYVPGTEETIANKETVEQEATVQLKPDMSELRTPPKSSNETLAILKAKRIIRHKNVALEDMPDLKKTKRSFL